MIFVNHFNLKDYKSVENNLDVLQLKTGDINQQIDLLISSKNLLKEQTFNHTQDDTCTCKLKDICQYLPHSCPEKIFLPKLLAQKSPV